MASKKTSPQNEETFHLLFAHHPIPMWIYDLKTLAFLEVNDTAQERYGFTHEEFLAMTLKDIRPAEDVERLLKDVEQKRPAIQQSGEWRHRLKNGEIIDVEITSHTLEFEGRSAVLVMAQNITERKRAEGALKASTEFSNNLIASMQDGVSVLDKEGVHLDVNPAFCRMTGFSREELIGSGIPHPYWPPEEYEQIQAALQQTLVNESASFELTFKRKNGERFPVIVSPFAIKDSLGSLVSYSATVKDITERRKTEEALRESEEKWHSLVSASPDYVALFDREGRFLFLNHYAENFTEEQVIGTSLFEYLSPESRELYRRKMEECLSTLTSQKFEYSAMGDYGIFKTYEQYLVPISNVNQEIELLAIARDVTERKEVEDALRESEQNLNILFETMSEGIALNEIIYDENGEMVDYRVLNVNQAFYSMADYRGKNVVGAFATKLYGMSPEFIKEFWKGHKEKKSTAYTEMVSPLGNRLFFVATSPFVNDKFVTSFFDITERKQVEEALRASEEKFRSLLDSQESNILVIDFDGVHHYVNQAGVASITDSGTTQNIIGKRLHDLYPAHIADWQLEQIRRVITTGQGVSGDFQNQSSWWHLNLQPIRNASGQVVQVMVNSHDITERKQAEEKIYKLNASLEQRVEERTRELRDIQEHLVRHEKLAVIGQMASSVGHELRNPLGVIASAVYYLKLVQPNADAKIKEYLGIIDQEVRTSEKIITDLLDFARVRSVDREAVSVPDLIRQTLERFAVPAAVNVTLEIPTDLPQVYVDIHQITQVLGNLTVNACQAMTSGGVQNGRQLSLYSRIQNDMIIITVKDNGTGIAPQNTKKLFEPLFTTKAKGIGLGLAVSRKLIEANGGRIEVESEPGKGSSFHVFLPIYRESK